MFAGKQHQNAGYTLVELLVTVGIYSLAFTAIAAIFLGYTMAQSRAASAQRLLSEGNYIFEQIAREVRINALDYACTGANYSTDTDYLCLKTFEGRQVHLRRTGSGPYHIEVCKKNDLLPCSGAAWQRIDPDFVTIIEFDFHTYPDVNPLDTAVAAKAFHPLIVVEASMEAGNALKKQRYDFQTAISSRAYDF